MCFGHRGDRGEKGGPPPNGCSPYANFERREEAEFLILSSKGMKGANGTLEGYKNYPIVMNLAVGGIPGQTC